MIGDFFMTNEERIQMIEEAMQLIAEAQQLVDDSLNDTNLEAHYFAYGRYGFDQLLNAGNPYDSGLNDLIKELQN